MGLLLPLLFPAHVFKVLYFKPAWFGASPAIFWFCLQLCTKGETIHDSFVYRAHSPMSIRRVLPSPTANSKAHRPYRCMSTAGRLHPCLCDPLPLLRSRPIINQFEATRSLGRTRRAQRSNWVVVPCSAMLFPRVTGGRLWLNAAVAGVVEEDVLRWKRKLWFANHRWRSISPLSSTSSTDGFDDQFTQACWARDCTWSWFLSAKSHRTNRTFTLP